VYPILSNITIPQNFTTWFIVGFVMLVLLMAGDVIRGLIRQCIADLINFIRRQPSIEQEKQQTWLDVVLKSDLDKTKIFRRDWSLTFDGFAMTDPYFDLVIEFINSNVYPITVIGIEGRFLIEGQEPVYPVELSTQRIPHGEAGNIRFRQRISNDMKKLIINQAKSQLVTISLTNCQIRVKREIEGNESDVIVRLSDPPIQANLTIVLRRYIEGL
jgi:hypothetical protein